MGKNTELLKQLREIIDPPTTSPLPNDIDTKLRMLEKFINSRYVPKATHDKKLNGLKHQALRNDLQPLDVQSQDNGSLRRTSKEETN